MPSGSALKVTGVMGNTNNQYHSVKVRVRLSWSVFKKNFKRTKGDTYVYYMLYCINVYILNVSSRSMSLISC